MLEDAYVVNEYDGFVWASVTKQLGSIIITLSNL